MAGMAIKIKDTIDLGVKLIIHAHYFLVKVDR
jgi:hypothetical protein